MGTRVSNDWCIIILLQFLLSCYLDPFISVEKQSPCLLSFVYTSYIRYGVRAAPKFGNHASLFLYYKDKKYVLAIICSVIVLSFSSMCMLENIC